MLCGRQATDYTMASCTSLFDQKTLNWSDELFESAGLDKALFPEALPSGTVLGGVTEGATKKTGLKKGTPVILGGHDYICASLAVGAFVPDVIMAVTGTWAELPGKIKAKYGDDLDRVNEELYEMGLTGLK